MRKNKCKEKVKGICVCVCLVISRSTGKLGLLVYCARPSTPCPHGNGRKAYRKKGKIHAKSKAATTKKKERKGKPSEEKQQKEANHRHQSNDRAGANDVENRECCRQHSGIAATSTAVRHQTAVTRRSQSPNQPLKRQVTTTASVCCRVLLFLLLSPHTHTRTCMNTRAL